MPEKKYHSQSLNNWQCLGVPFTLHIILFSTLIQQRNKRGKTLRKWRGWELFIPWLASYRRSMFFRWLILAKVHNSRLSTLFPAMASLSTALNLSSTAGMWEKLLKESPRLLSWERPPSSSGRELRWFPSRESVCRLPDERRETVLLQGVVKISACVHVVLYSNCLLSSILIVDLNLFIDAFHWIHLNLNPDFRRTLIVCTKKCKLLTNEQKAKKHNNNIHQETNEQDGNDYLYYFWLLY